MSPTQTANSKYTFTHEYVGKKLSEWITAAHNSLANEFCWENVTILPGTFEYDVMASSLVYALTYTNKERKLSELAKQMHIGWCECYVYWRDNKPWLKKHATQGYVAPKKPLGDELRNISVETEFEKLHDDEQEKYLVLARFMLGELENVKVEKNDITEEITDESTIEVDESWVDVLSAEMEKPYYATLTEKVAAERVKYPVFPPDKQVFRALNLTGLDSVRVVILGQDPYHGPEQAHGLSFSVSRGQTVPPSLVNIFKEINADLGLPIPKHGCLETWAKNGVLLLNTTLTVRCKSPASHASFGWNKLTDVLIRTVSNCTEHTVFLLWGKHAQEKSVLIDKTRHLVLEAAHPSPMSAHTGFMGCKHFSKTNAYLEKHGKPAIDWSLPI